MKNLFTFEAKPIEAYSQYDEAAGLLVDFEGETTSLLPEAEAEFSFLEVPAPVLKALHGGLESMAIKLAVAGGNRDENRLTNLIFFARHPERKGQKISRGEPGFSELSREWVDIRDSRPALREPPVLWRFRQAGQSSGRNHETSHDLDEIDWRANAGRALKAYDRNRNQAK